MDALTNRINQMAVKSSDWSNWDDTYQYITDHNKAYVTANLVDQSLTTLQVNFMLFYNAQHKLVTGLSVDENGNDAPLPPALLAYFATGSKLFCDNPTDLETGFLSLPTDPIMFAARPILRSDETGPSRGTLLFGEYLSPAEITALANQTHEPLEFYHPNALPSDAKTVGTIGAKTASVRVLSQNQIAGYQTVDDFFNHPILIARVVQPRDIFLEANKSLLYFLVIIAFVTLLSMILAYRLAGQVARRDQTIQLKNEFFSIASHELRTPLGAIRGNSSMLLEIYGSKNDNDFTTITSDIHEASVRLIRLVTNFLEAARLEKGKIPLAITSFPLSDTVSGVVHEMQGLAAEKKIYIKSDIPKNLPMVDADLDRVKQVIYNLVGNAAKFTETGGITITARAESQLVKILITDTGRGISPEGQKALFKRFQQTQADDAGKGSGLGLYISKMLVGLMGGQIRIESSTVGKGTVLGFTLPASKGKTPASSQLHK